MACYVIGDVQGCYHELQALLQLVNYNDSKDQLIFVGDLINRGPDSLETLRFIRSLNNVRVTLGNHDLYFLALGYQAVTYDGHHTLHALLDAPDLIEHLDWLRQQPLLIADEALQLIAVHAGIPPQWSLVEAKQHAQELSATLRGPSYIDFLKNMVGKTPMQWNDKLTGNDRLRYITNALTRMRFCDADGSLELDTKSSKTIDLPGYKPWFEWPHDLEGKQLIFGHWASLMGECATANMHAIDTGCVWGNTLTALRIDDNNAHTFHHVPSSQIKHQ